MTIAGDDMAQLNIRLDDEMRDLLGSLAHARGLNVSDLVRVLIGQALGRGDSDRTRDDVTPVSLSALDRRKLALQHELLANTTENEYEAEHHRKMVKVLEYGFTGEYYMMFQQFQSEMTDRENELVYDILEMFLRIEHSYGELTDAERASLGKEGEWATSFGGFDFNDSRESRLASYARYLIEDGKWEQLATYFEAKRDYGNSHSPMLPSYIRMRAVWKPMWDRKVKTMGGPNSYRFTVEELAEIVAAWPYPKD